MKAVERITQLSHRIFNTTLTEKSVARASNPFANTNFQMNILTEDVYNSSNNNLTKKLGLTEKLSASSKRIYSVFTGSINDFSERFHEGLETIVQFGKKMKEGIVGTFHKISELGNKEISLASAKELLNIDVAKIFNSRERAINKMANMDPQTQLKPMLMEALSSLENEMVIIG